MGYQRRVHGGGSRDAGCSSRLYVRRCCLLRLFVLFPFCMCIYKCNTMTSNPVWPCSIRREFILIESYLKDILTRPFYSRLVKLKLNYFVSFTTLTDQARSS